MSKKELQSSNGSKTLRQYTDLELCKAQGQLYQQLLLVQSNMTAINAEIARREALTKVKPAEVAEVN